MGRAHGAFRSEDVADERLQIFLSFTQLFNGHAFRQLVLSESDLAGKAGGVVDRARYWLNTRTSRHDQNPDRESDDVLHVLPLHVATRTLMPPVPKCPKRLSNGLRETPSMLQRLSTQ